MATRKKTVVPTTVRIPEDIKQELERAAEEQESNSSTLVRQILRGWQKKRRGSQQKAVADQ